MTHLTPDAQAFEQAKAVRNLQAARDESRTFVVRGGDSPAICWFTKQAAERDARTRFENRQIDIGIGRAAGGTVWVDVFEGSTRVGRIYPTSNGWEETSV